MAAVVKQLHLGKDPFALRNGEVDCGDGCKVSGHHRGYRPLHRGIQIRAYNRHRGIKEGSLITVDGSGEPLIVYLTPLVLAEVFLGS